METNPYDYINPQEYRTSQYATVPDTMIEGGLTKREYFAAMAMQGWISFNGGHVDRAAEAALEYADALIIELNKEKV